MTARQWFSYALRRAPADAHVVPVAARYAQRHGSPDHARAILDQAEARDPQAHWLAEARRQLDQYEN